MTDEDILRSLDSIKMFAALKYEQAYRAKYDADDREEKEMLAHGATVSDVFTIRNRRTYGQMEREIYRWMYLMDVSRIAEKFIEQTRLANMTDEAYTQEQQNNNLQKAEAALALAKKEMEAKV